MSVPPHVVAEFDQGRVVIRQDLDELVEGYRGRAAIDGTVIAHVATHSVVAHTWPASSLALLLTEAVSRLAGHASGGEPS